jgi:hypothetical protein
MISYNASAIHKELTTYFGYDGGYTVVKEAVRPLRPKSMNETPALETALPELSSYRACADFRVEASDLQIYEKLIGGYHNE